MSCINVVYTFIVGCKKMREAKRHFVLVHGACHGAWCWYKVATLLKAAGHRVTVPDMAASGVHPKQVHQITSLSDYFQPLIQLMAALAEEEQVILVGHSFGGVCLSAAMESFPHKISAAVFVTALVIGPNLTYRTLHQQYNERQDNNMDNKFTFEEGPKNPPTSLLFGPNYTASKMYHLSPPQDTSLALTMFRPFRLHCESKAEEETVVTHERFGSVRRIYVICDEDKTLNEDFQKWIVENNPMDHVITLSGSDHMPMFSKPQELFSSLQEIAYNFI